MAKDAKVSFEVFDNLPEAYYLVSREGMILEANKAALEKLNITRKELLRKKFTEVLHNTAIPDAEKALKNCGAGCICSQFDARMRIGNEETILTRINVAAFKTKSSKNPEKILIVARDITGEKQKNRDLQRLQFVFHNTVNPIQFTDLAGKIVDVNEAFMEASGYDREELIGQNPSVFGSGKHPKSFWKRMWDIISKGEPWEGEVENRRKSGEPFYTRLLISPIIDNEDNIIGYFGLHRDIGEKKQLEKQLIHTQKMESIGTLAAGVAHEVGNPLASISALVQIMQRNNQDEFTLEKLELVKKQINRISKIIRDLVDFSKPSDNELQLIDINANLIEAVDIVKVGKKTRDIEFITELDDNIKKMPLVSDQIQQVFVNIFINAVDSILERQSDEGSSFNGSIKTASLDYDDHISIVIEDNGVGIPEDEQNKIFEPFFTRKKDRAGTGLGLWVSYNIIKAFHGTIRLESKVNTKTTFFIDLPKQR